MTNPRGSTTSITRPASGPLVTVSVTLIGLHRSRGERLRALDAPAAAVFVGEAVPAESSFADGTEVNGFPRRVIRTHAWLEPGLGLLRGAASLFDRCW